MRKVLFTASTFSHIRNFHLPYLAQFKRLGWQVHVACGGELPQDAAAISGADAVFALPLEKKMLAAGNFKAAALLRKKIAAEQYALISTHTALAAFFTRLALPPAPRPLLLNMVHGYLFDDQTPAMKKTVLLWAEKLMAGCTDLLLTMNQWDQAAAERYRLGYELGFIPGIGVDFARFAARQDEAKSQTLRQELGLGPEDRLLLYAAEFSGRKSQAVLLRALAGMRERLAAEPLPGRVVLLLAGEGTELTACQNLAEQLGLLAAGDGPVQAIFPGQLTAMPLWYGAADIAVSASRSEGLPFNIMEAMYAGLPVVASAVKGHTDLLQPEVSGLLYPYGDASACGDLLLRLLREPDLAARLGAEAQRQVQQYGLERVFPKVWAQYERLINRL